MPSSEPLDESMIPEDGSGPETLASTFRGYLATIDQAQRDHALARRVERKSVYQIEDDAQRLGQMLLESDGELTPEIEAWWEQHKLEAAAKVDRISALWRDRQTDIGAIDAEISRLTGLRHVHANTCAVVEGLVDRLLTALDKREIAGPLGGVWKRIGHGGNRPMAVTFTDLEKLSVIAPDLVEQPEPVPPPKRIRSAAIRAILDREEQHAKELVDAAVQLRKAEGRPADDLPDPHKATIDLLLRPTTQALPCEGALFEQLAALDQQAEDRCYVDGDGRVWELLRLDRDPGAQASGIGYLRPIVQEADYGNAAADYRLVTVITPAGGKRPDLTRDIPIATLEPRGYSIKLRTPSTTAPAKKAK